MQSLALSSKVAHTNIALDRYQFRYVVMSATASPQPSLICSPESCKPDCFLQRGVHFSRLTVVAARAAAGGARLPTGLVAVVGVEEGGLRSDGHRTSATALWDKAWEIRHT